MATNGHRGRFSDRLKLIRLRKAKKWRNIYKKDGNKAYFNILKIIATVPMMVYDNIFMEDNSQNTLGMKLNNDKQSIDVMEKKYVKKHVVLNYKTVKSIDSKSKVIGNDLVRSKSHEKLNNRNIIENIDVSLMKKNANNFINGKYSSIRKCNVCEKESIEEVKKIEKRVIDRIKKNLIKSINELEILRGDLYILSEINDNKEELVKCEKNLQDIKKLLHKIDALKNKYDYLRDNYDFEYIMELDDRPLIDDILLLKDMISSDEIKVMVEDYKLLDVYKYLYLKIDTLQDNMSEYYDYKNTRVMELKDRDIDFNEFKNKVYNMDKEKQRYDLFITEQERMLNGLNDNINKINTRYVVDYHLKGFGNLLSKSFRYFGLLTLSPLRGMVPSLAVETIATKNMVNNLYHNLVWEERKYKVYEAVNYEEEINNIVNDIDGIGRVIDNTLEDIVNLKMQYNQQFKQYQGNFSEYRDVIGKLNNIENKIMGNKIKVEIIKKQMLEQQKANDKKMKIVKKLNDEEQRKL